MTTARQIKRLFAPLLERNADLALVAPRHVLLHPLHHVIRGICIDGSSEAKMCAPTWFIGALFDNGSLLPMRTGGFVMPRYWDLTAPNVASAFCERVEAETLPQLRAIRTVADYVTLGESLPFFDTPFAWPEQRMLAHVAMGEFDAARVICRKWSKVWDDDDDPGRWADQERWRIMRTPLMNDDRPALIALLHEWEARTAARLKIDHLWEPTPFPLEEMT